MVQYEAVNARVLFTRFLVNAMGLGRMPDFIRGSKYGSANAATVFLLRIYMF